MGIAILIDGMNWAERNLGQITPTGNVPVQQISINGPNQIVNSGQYMANLIPVFTTQRNVVWSITSGSQYAEIDQTGTVLAKVGANSSPVTIRATSINNNQIWAEKTISVTIGNVLYFDWLESDGNCYIELPWIYLLGGKIISKMTYTTPNGYPWGGQYSSTARFARMGTYKRSAGDIGIVCGDAGYVGTNITPQVGKVYRLEYITSTTETTKDGEIYFYDEENDELLWSRTSVGVYLNFNIGIFCYGANSGANTPFNPGNFSTNKLYSFEMYDANNVKIMDLKPITFGGECALLDVVNNIIYTKKGDGILTVGID